MRRGANHSGQRSCAADPRPRPRACRDDDDGLRLVSEDPLKGLDQAEGGHDARQEAEPQGRARAGRLRARGVAQ